MNSSVAFSLQTFLLGQSAHHVLLRLTLILSILLFIWIVLIVLSIIVMRQQTDKRAAHSRVYNRVELTRPAKLEHHRRMNSSSTSIASRKWYSFYHRFPSFRSIRSWTAPPIIPEQDETRPPENSAKVHAVIEAMTRRSFTSSQRSVGTQRNSLAPPAEPEKKIDEPAAALVSPVEPRPRAMTAAPPPTGFLQNLSRRLSAQIPTLNSERSRASVFRLTSSPARTIDPFPLHWSTPGPHHRTRNADLDASLDSIQRQLPLVMITDTNCSFTNIVELDTFEDEKHVITDIERRLKQQLKTFYRPRYST